MSRSLFVLFALAGCDGLTGSRSPCSADFTLSFPDGSSVDLDFCESYTMEATYEFDPDDPPELRAPTMEFNATTEPGFECRVFITEPAACGEGFYTMDGSSGSVSFSTLDCSGVADDFEGEFVSSTGYVRLDLIDAGDEAGSFTGEPLTTNITGYLSVRSVEGVALTGDFTISQDVVAEDAEESGCAVSNGDEDDDGYVDEYFDGDDCDDAREDTHPGVAANEEDSSECRTDEDGDRYGAMYAGEGVSDGTDCDDSDYSINPSAEEVAWDGADNDCDGVSSHPASLLAAGADHSCAVDLEGENIYCWGSDSYGQSSAPDEEFTQLAAGGYHTCGLKADGQVKCWGGNAYGQTTAPGGSFSLVSAAYYNTCAITQGGEVQCWGRDDDGQSSPPEGDFIQVSAGYSCSCGVDESGVIECWGATELPQCAPPAGEFSAVSVGNSFSCALSLSGEVICWGTATEPPTGTFKQVAAGGYYACAVATDGSVQCWGVEGTDEHGLCESPTAAFSFIDASNAHVCGITEMDEVDCWGYGGTGASSPP